MCGDGINIKSQQNIQIFKQLIFMGKKLLPFDAQMEMDGVDVLADWRYTLIVPYIMQSPSFIAVRDAHRGLRAAKNGMPRDAATVLSVAERFDILGLDSCEDFKTNHNWWMRVGRYLYGTKTKIPEVAQELIRAGESAVIEVASSSYPTIALQVPLTLTATEALNQIRFIFQYHTELSRVNFGQPLPERHHAEYKLLPSRLRQDTLANGVQALAKYRAGVPLWRIGNELALSPSNAIDERDETLDQDIVAGKKRVLSIMSHRLIKTAALVAENAARGRFPCDEPFPEAMLDAFTRKAGRPVGSKRPKRIKTRSA